MCIPYNILCQLKICWKHEYATYRYPTFVNIKGLTKRHSLKLSLLWLDVLNNYLYKQCSAQCPAIHPIVQNIYTIMLLSNDKVGAGASVSCGHVFRS